MTVLDEYIAACLETFGEGAAVGGDGFIVHIPNVHCPSVYGFSDSLYYKNKKKCNFKKLALIKSLNRDERLYCYDLGLITEQDVYECFETVYYEHNRGIDLYDEYGTRQTVYGGTFCNRKGYRSRYIQKSLKQGIGEITDCILLTLTTHEKEVESFMPDNTNLLPVQYAICNIGRWLRYFLKRLMQYQKTQGISWEYVGYVLEFQKNGYPHAHIIFRGNYLGDIKKIAGLWPYCAPQGIDYSDRKKYERQLRKEGKLGYGHVKGIALVNYVCAYVGKAKNGVDKELGVHRSYAWMWFAHTREFNVSHRYRSDKENNKPKRNWTFKKVNNNRILDHICEKCGQKIYSDSIDMISHVCLPEKKNC